MSLSWIDFLWNLWKGPLNHEGRLRRLNEAVSLIGRMHGAPAKIGQMLALVPGLMPQAYQDILARLHHNSPPVPFEALDRFLMRDDPLWKKAFDAVDRQSLCSASLGQVHRAYKNGRDLVCKIAYPSIQEDYARDSKWLKRLSWVYASFFHGLDAESVRLNIDRMLRQEMCYIQEVRAQQRMSHIFAGYQESVCIPHVYEDMCHKHIIVSDFVPSTPFCDLRISKSQARHLGGLLVWAWLYPLFHYGFLHGDPHPGNYGFCVSTRRLCLYDFGCTVRLSSLEVKGMYALYDGLDQGCDLLKNQGLKAMGFGVMHPKVRQAVLLWATYILHPFLLHRAVRFDEVVSSQEALRLALYVHSLCCEHGPLRIPPSFLWLDRVCVGLGSALIGLKARMPWRELFWNIRSSSPLFVHKR